MPPSPKQIKSILPAKPLVDQSTSRMRANASPSKFHNASSIVNMSQAGGLGGGVGGTPGDESEYAAFQTRTLAKPDDQLTLSPDDMKEEYPRILCTKDFHLPSNLVEYSFRESAYITPKQPVGTVRLFSYEGSVIPLDSEEAQYQLRYGPVETTTTEVRKKTTKKKKKGDDDDDEDEAEGEDEKPEEPAAEPEPEAEPTEEGGEEAEEAGEEDGEEDGEEEDKAVDAEESATLAPDDDAESRIFSALPKKIQNQFNFCERAAMTYNNPFRDMQCETVPPCRQTYSSQVMQWIIFDSYEEDYDIQQKAKEAEKGEAFVFGHVAQIKHDPHKEEMKLKEEKALAIVNKTLLAAKTIERMITQNIYDDIAQDFRYWEDPADLFCEEGTLLPLWKFTFEKTERNLVTSICWNPCYFDFFAVSFGYYSFSKLNQQGAVCLFTLKNPSYPEFICYQDFCIMSVDVHPKYPNLLVLGMSDGNVAIFNVQLSNTEPLSASNTSTGKHGAIVWQVKWADDTPDDEVNFYSISSDGNVYQWILVFDRLEKTLILPLTIPGPRIPEEDGLVFERTSCGSSFTIHPTNPEIFLAGTEEGSIYQCSTLYSSTPLLIYNGHTMPVHRICYNTYYPKIFLSCSADWRIKIWEDGRLKPLFMFDLGCPVGDVEWAPFSSTLFAACTHDGRVCVYDLNINKYEPICIQHVVSRKKNILTRLAFNQKFPFLIVGDDKGCTTALKLSPNLRKPIKPAKKGPVYTMRELEIMKLEKILVFVLEPVTISIPASEAATQ